MMGENQYVQYRSGLYYSDPVGPTNTTITAAANTLYLHAIYVHSSRMFDQIATRSAATGNARLGLWRLTPNGLLHLVHDTGSFALGTGANARSCSLYLGASHYFAGVVYSGTPLVHVGSQAVSGVGQGADSMTATSTVMGYTYALTFGALPMILQVASLTVVTSAAALPRVALRAV